MRFMPMILKNTRTLLAIPSFNGEVTARRGFPKLLKKSNQPYACFQNLFYKWIFQIEIIRRKRDYFYFTTD